MENKIKYSTRCFYFAENKCEPMSFSRYSVSNLSCTPHDVIDIKSGKPISTCMSNGTLCVSLTADGGGKRKLRVHRLRLSSFNKIPWDSSLTVNHKDGNVLNGDIGNLRWATASEQHETIKRSSSPGLCRQVIGIGPSSCVEHVFSSVTEATKKMNTCEQTFYKYLRSGKPTPNGWLIKSAPIELLPDEIFKDFTSTVRISNMHRIMRRKHDKSTEWFITQTKPGTGYEKLTDTDGVKRSMQQIISRLFLNYDERKRRLQEQHPGQTIVINHIDERILNNQVSNLEVVTQSQNVLHSRGKTFRVTNKSTGEVSDHFSAASTAKALGWHRTTVHRVVTGRIQRSNYKIEIVADRSVKKLRVDE